MKCQFQALILFLTALLVLCQYDVNYADCVQCPRDFITEETKICSPLFPNYTTFWECGYIIQAPHNKKVLATFEVFDMPGTGGNSILYTDQSVCNSVNTEENYDYVEIWKNSDIDIHKKYYNRDLQGVELMSKGNRMQIRFQAMSPAIYGGFVALIQFIDKKKPFGDHAKDEIIDEAGTLKITSAQLSTEKDFTIKAPDGKVVQISISIDTKAGLQGCQFLDFRFANLSRMYQDDESRLWSKCDADATGKTIQATASTAILTVSPKQKVPEDIVVNILIKFITPSELCGGDADAGDELTIPADVIKAMVGQPLICFWTYSITKCTLLNFRSKYTTIANEDDQLNNCVLAVNVINDKSLSYETKHSCGNDVTFTFTSNVFFPAGKVMVMFGTNNVTATTAFTASAIITQEPQCLYGQIGK